jgi:hypothetical protein
VTSGEIFAALLGSGITAIMIIGGQLLYRFARLFGGWSRAELRAEEDARTDALIDAAYERVKEMEAGRKSRS